MTISRWIILRMGNVLDKSCRENQNTHLTLSNLFFFRKSCGLWDNDEKSGGARGATNDVTIWRKRIVCWISKAICTHARACIHPRSRAHARTRARAHTHKYVIFIAFPGQQWLRERASVLSYIACLVLVFPLQSYISLTRMYKGLNKMKASRTLCVTVIQGVCVGVATCTLFLVRRRTDSSQKEERIKIHGTFLPSRKRLLYLN